MSEIVSASVIAGITAAVSSRGELPSLLAKLFVIIVGGGLLVLTIYAGIWKLYSKLSGRVSEDILRDLEELDELMEGEIDE